MTLLPLTATYRGGMITCEHDGTRHLFRWYREGHPELGVWAIIPRSGMKVACEEAGFALRTAVDGWLDRG